MKWIYFLLKMGKVNIWKTLMCMRWLTIVRVSSRISSKTNERWKSKMKFNTVTLVIRLNTLLFSSATPIRWSRQPLCPSWFSCSSREGATSLEMRQHNTVIFSPSSWVSAHSCHKPMKISKWLVISQWSISSTWLGNSSTYFNFLF